MPSEKKQDDSAKKVLAYLEKENLQILSQMSIVLENGETLPIKGLISQSFVINKEEDGRVEPTDTDSGEGKDEAGSVPVE